MGSWLNRTALCALRRVVLAPRLTQLDKIAREVHAQANACRCLPPGPAMASGAWSTIFFLQGPAGDWAHLCVRNSASKSKAQCHTFHHGNKEPTKACKGSRARTCQHRFANRAVLKNEACCICTVRVFSTIRRVPGSAEVGSRSFGGCLRWHAKLASPTYKLACCTTSELCESSETSEWNTSESKIERLYASDR